MAGDSSVVVGAGTRAAETTREARWAHYKRGFQVRGWRHLVAILAALFALFPVVWIISASFNAVDNLGASRLIPQQVTLDNFVQLFRSTVAPVPTWLFNSFKVALVAAGLNVIIASFAAYAFSRLRFRGRRGLLTLLAGAADLSAVPGVHRLLRSRSADRWHRPRGRAQHPSLS